MRFVWICAVFACLFIKNGVCSISIPKLTKRSPCYESEEVQEESISPEPLSELLRIKNELNELYKMTYEYIQANFDDNTPGLNDFRAADIIRKLIDTNETRTLVSFRSSCPLYRKAEGIYTVNLTGMSPFPVLCNTKLAGPGWIVIASRTVGDLNFFRKWEEYKQGFGNLSNEFFIGLEKLHVITDTQPHELYIYLEDFTGNKRYARYNEFLVGSEKEQYAMKKLGTFSGDAYDNLSYNAGKKFTTHDKDNDGSSDNCAIERMGAWWYANCTDSNLFGLYLGGKYHNKLNGKGMFWHNWLGRDYSYKVVKMMVRPRCPCLYES